MVKAPAKPRSRRAPAPSENIETLAETENIILKKAQEIGFNPSNFASRKRDPQHVVARLDAYRLYMVDVAAPLALANIIDVLERPGSPNARTRAELSMRVLDRIGIAPREQDAGHKAIDEMTREQLQARVEQYERAIADRAKPAVIEAQATDILE